MVDVIYIAVIAALGAIGWQDIRDRMVSLWLLIGVIGLQVWLWGESHYSSWDQLTQSGLWLASTIVMVAIYALLRFGSNVRHHVGLGDLLILVLIPFSFSSWYGLLALGLSSTLGVLASLISKDARIPFCTCLSIVLIGVFIARLVNPKFCWV